MLCNSTIWASPQRKEKAMRMRRRISAVRQSFLTLRVTDHYKNLERPITDYPIPAFLKYILINQWPPHSNAGVTFVMWHSEPTPIPSRRMMFWIFKSCQRKHPICFTSVTCGDNHISKPSVHISFLLCLKVYLCISYISSLLAWGKLDSSWHERTCD